jgi:hypothetical protein
MAGFNETPRPSNDPSYLGFSQGTEKASLQPLAQVPELNTKYVQPDYRANRSAGSLFEGLADIGKSAVAAADGIIKKNIDDNLNEGINKIRDGFGVGAAVDQSSGIATAVGKAGAEGVSLINEDNTKLPVAVNRLGNKIDGLTEAYRQGTLSNSAYYAKMEAFVRQTIQQYPGYATEVREMAAGKLGTNPANALRTALLNDVTALQGKVQAQNDKWTTYENQNAQYIYSRWPNYEALKASGTAPSQGEIRQWVGQMQARDYSFQSKIAGFNAGKIDYEKDTINAEAVATGKAYDVASNLVLTIPNSMGIKTPADYTKLLNDVRNGQRPPLSPEEKTQLSGIIMTMKQQYALNFDKFMNDTSQGPRTLAVALANPTKYNAIKAQGMQGIADLEDGLVNEKTGLLVSTANQNKAYMDAAENSVLRSSTAPAHLAAGRKFYGDQGLMLLMAKNPPLVNAALEGLRGVNQAVIAQPGGPDGQAPKSLREVIDLYKKEGQNDGNLNRVTIQDTVNTILNADKTAAGEAAAQAAVKHAFGPANTTLLGAWQQKNQVDVFTQLVRPEVSARINKMDKASRETYYGWANDSFTTVFTDQVSQANKTAQDYKYNGKLSIVYDPATQNFRFESGSSFGLGKGVFGTASVPGGIVGAANQGLAPLNAAINTMKDVWKAQGRDVTEALAYNLPVAGIEPGTPVYEALQKVVREQQAEAETKK